jgi:hypothetical protein
MKNTNSVQTISESDRDLQEIILENSKDTLTGINYRIETILPSELWLSLTKEEHISIGKSFMRLSKAGLIPYQYIGKTSANHNLYKRLP